MDEADLLSKLAPDDSLVDDEAAAKNDDLKLKIAILGAGISGCSCAYFLNDIFKDKCEITVFESSSRVGGRLDTYEFNERTYEIGGTIIHSSNLYMKRFMEICDLKQKDIDKENDSLVIFDSNGIVFKETGKWFGIVDTLNFFKHFGVFQLLKLKSWIKSLVTDFAKIYKLQDKGFTFTNLKEFLENLSPNLYSVSQDSLRSVMKKKNFNDRIINYLASIACLCNYGQSVDVDGFVGIISLAGMQGDLYSIKGGNYQVPTKLLEKSKARLLTNTHVKSVSIDPNDPSKNIIVYKDHNSLDDVADSSFDYVIISFPIYNQIESDNFYLNFDSRKQLQQLEMKLVNTYAVDGSVRLFSELPKERRLQLLDSDASYPYRSISVQLPVDFSEKSDKDLYVKDQRKLYKIFSNKACDEKDFEKIFESDYKLVKYVPWMAYPKYRENPKEKSIPNVILDSSDRSRVYYTNALEWSSSCMEICSISSRNVSMLIGNKESKLLNSNKKGVNKVFKKFFKNYESLKIRKSSNKLHSLSKALSILALFGFILASFFRY